MPAKYSHVKKRPPNAHQRKNKNNVQQTSHGHAHRNPNPLLDRTISQAMTAVSELERAISKILLLRYEQDIARLYSTRLHNVVLIYLPKLMLDCIAQSASPGWVAANADSDEVKDFIRSAIAMDMRQAGERVATKSVLWSYTALRHFAMSNGVYICPKRGLHSLRLLPHFPALQTHLDTLSSLPLASFSKPTHLPSLDESLDLLEDDLERNTQTNKNNPAWEDWRVKVRVGYERLVDTLWNVAKEFDVRGYGLILREKLTTKWCDCGCSTDHLGEVCERTVREEEEESGIRPGKGREWDGRGSGVFGWQTEEEEDIWEMELDFGGLEPDECDDPEMTIGELMEWRYFKAERAKEQGNKEFRNCDYEAAIKHYKSAHEIEPELPHYQLNIAAAHLKLSNWMAAEKACNVALGQHRSGKGYWRRAKARRMLGKTSEAIKDLRAVLKLQPTNAEVLAELESILETEPPAYKARILRDSLKYVNGGSYSGSGPGGVGMGVGTGYGHGHRYGHGPGLATGNSSSSSSSSSSPSSSSSSSLFSSPSSSTSSAYTSFSASSSSSSSTPETLTHSQTLATSPSSPHSKSKPTPKSQQRPPSPILPFTPTELDKCRLRISTVALQVEMPVIKKREVNGEKGSVNGKGKGAGATNSSGNGASRKNGKGNLGEGSIATFELQIETYSYPTWERCKVQKVSR